MINIKMHWLKIIMISITPVEFDDKFKSGYAIFKIYIYDNRMWNKIILHF